MSWSFPRLIGGANSSLKEVAKGKVKESSDCPTLADGGCGSLAPRGNTHHLPSHSCHPTRSPVAKVVLEGETTPVTSSDSGQDLWVMRVKHFRAALGRCPNTLLMILVPYPWRLGRPLACAVAEVEGAEDVTPESTPLVGAQPMEVLTQGTVTDPVLGAQR